MPLASGRLWSPVTGMAASARIRMESIVAMNFAEIARKKLQIAHAGAGGAWSFRYVLPQTALAQEAGAPVAAAECTG